MYFHTRRVSIKLKCIRNPAGFLACPSVLDIAIARAVPTGGPRYYSTQNTHEKNSTETLYKEATHATE